MDDAKFGIKLARFEPVYILPHRIPLKLFPTRLSSDRRRKDNGDSSGKTGRSLAATYTLSRPIQGLEDYSQTHCNNMHARVESGSYNTMWSCFAALVLCHFLMH